MASKEYVYKSQNGSSTKFAGETWKDILEQVAEYQAIFENDMECGFCNSDEIYFNVRDVDGNKYYEKKCRKCTAAKTFHQNKKGGGLYMKWSDKWAKYVPKANDGEEDESQNKPATKKGK